MENNKRVLITGGAGFIGANLARKLVSLPDFKVFIIEKRKADLWRIKDIINQLNVRYADLEDCPVLAKVIREIKPQIVFHLASYGVYPHSENDFKKMVGVNIAGTVNLIESLKNFSLSSFVNASTCFVYKEKITKLRENDLTCPLNFYAATKLAAELLLKKIAQDDNLPVISLRIFTPYGYYENNQRLIPYIILNALKNRKIALASPNNVRDFIFIEDVISLFLRIIRSDHHYRGEIFNIGSGKQYRTQDIVGIIEELLGKKLNVSYRARTSYYREPKFFSADNAKSRNAFNWKINYNIKSGIGKTIDWFKLYENRKTI